MKRLRTDPGLVAEGQQQTGHAPADDFYALLIDTHRGLDDAQSELLNARLVLLLANHIGDLGVLQEALQLARRGVFPGGNMHHTS